MAALLQDLEKNMFGIGNVEMYKASRNGTKLNIELYHNEVIGCLRMLYYYNGNKLTAKQKLDYFKQLKRRMGNSALLLSGGAGLGKYHYGLIKALWECDLLPNIICGSSAGSLIAAGICVFKREEVPYLFIHEVAWRRPLVQWTTDDKFERLNKLFVGDGTVLSAD